jgi:hypothetical protein
MAATSAALRSSRSYRTSTSRCRGIVPRDTPGPAPAADGRPWRAPDPPQQTASPPPSGLASASGGTRHAACGWPAPGGRWRTAMRPGWGRVPGCGPCPGPRSSPPVRRPRRRSEAHRACGTSARPAAAPGPRAPRPRPRGHRAVHRTGSPADRPADAHCSLDWMCPSPQNVTENLREINGPVDGGPARGGARG